MTDDSLQVGSIQRPVSDICTQTTFLEPSVQLYLDRIFSPSAAGTKPVGQSPNPSMTLFFHQSQGQRFEGQLPQRCGM